ncbi:MAG: hypothetical protein LUE29_12815 [Lachnospiraceae bacterium]|nr:hypothetical protein [Lachnospiraceae bacterium]
MSDWNNEESKKFLDDVKEHLSYMPQRQKDWWIMNQAKLEEKKNYKSFLKSLSGNPDSLCLPEDEEIDAFCDRVSGGEIYLEFNMRYTEPEGFGDYIGDWEDEYRDPFQSMDYLDAILKGCHELIKIESYRHAAIVLEKVSRLEFSIRDHKSSEDITPEDDPFTLADVCDYQLLQTDRNQVAEDLIYACYMSRKEMKKRATAEKIADLLLLPVCYGFLPGDVLKYEADQTFFQFLYTALEKKAGDVGETLPENTFDFSAENERQERQQMHVQRVLHHLRELSEYEAVPEEEGKKLLTEAWSQIGDLLASLRYEPYIDDQFEIEEIWNICEELIQTHKCHTAPWSLRRQILSDIVENDYYDYYGCCDPMNDLVKELCVENWEKLEFADLLCQANGGKCTKEAAALYHEYGADEKYLKYLQENLGKTNREYVELMDYYEKHGALDKVVETGILALEKCKEDMTEIFILLIRAAWKRGDTRGAEDYYVKARRRKKIQIRKVEEAYASVKKEKQVCI